MKQVRFKARRISNNKVVAYLDAENNNDVDKYQNVDAFKEWLEKYIYLEK
jgi:hypothetical protein